MESFCSRLWCCWDQRRDVGSCTELRKYGAVWIMFRRIPGLHIQVSDKGVTSESHRNSGAGQANRTTGSRRGNSPPGRGEPGEFQEILLYQETQTGERLCVCAACQKTSKLNTGLLKQKQIHTRRNQVWSYICTDCRKSFGQHADLI